jgi:hypothetical protein
LWKATCPGRSKSAFKNLAVAESKHKKLLDVLNNRGPEVVQLSAGKTGAVAEVNLLKKLNKTEILTKSVLIKSLEAL